MSKVGIIMGSKSDYPVMKEAENILKDFGIDYEIDIVSAHRTPEKMMEYSKNAHKNGISVIKSPFQQYDNPLYSNNKIIGTYVNSIMAVNDAISKGAEEAILMDKNGYISEGSGENLFVVKNEAIITPTTDHCLNGITRGKTIMICQSNDIPILEKDFIFDDIIDCDEAFVTGTFAGIIPVSKIEGRNLKSTNADSLVNQIRLLYNKHIQENIY